MPAQLIALSEGPSILLDKPILLVGRHAECDIQLDSRKISRRHCCIAQVADYLVVRDLGSTNGIRINGIRILEGRLHPGDELTIGGLRYQVRWEPMPQVSMERLPAREVHKAARFADLADLDSCDEPVALPEGDVHSPPISPLPSGAAANAASAPESPEPEPILPDDLELARSSEFFKPPSHHGAG
jgi:predicted component of type VI protein secretion system